MSLLLHCFNRQWSRSAILTHDVEDPMHWLVATQRLPGPPGPSDLDSITKKDRVVLGHWPPFRFPYHEIGHVEARTQLYPYNLSGVGVLSLNLDPTSGTTCF